MIKFVDDVVPIGVVAAADILTNEKMPTWNRPFGLVLSAAGCGRASLTTSSLYR